MRISLSNMAGKFHRSWQTLPTVLVKHHCSRIDKTVKLLQMTNDAETVKSV